MCCAAEGEWQWASGAPFSFAQWHEGEPNDVDNEVNLNSQLNHLFGLSNYYLQDCLSMSSQDLYEWQDLGCDTRYEPEY